MNNKSYSEVFDAAARDTIPDSTDLSPRILRDIQKKKGLSLYPRLKIVAAILIAVLAFTIFLVNGQAVVYALQNLFGYVPGVGLVDNRQGMLVLKEPVSVTRDGVTVTITTVLVYQDHVELLYKVEGLPVAADGKYLSVMSVNDMNSFCFGPDSEAVLRLPDGTVVRRVFSHVAYPEYIFENKPVSESMIPSDEYEMIPIPASVKQMTMVLKCLPSARREAFPEDWEVAFQVVPAPAGTRVGKPVIEVGSSDLSSVSDDGIAITLEKVVHQADRYSFYFSVASAAAKDAMPFAMYPLSAYLIDSQGQKIMLNYQLPWQPQPYIPNGAFWEFQPASKPADGPLIFVIDRLSIDYRVYGVWFEFDPGADPQLGQTWTLDQNLSIAGNGFKVVSARLVEKPEYREETAITNPRGFEFEFRALDGKTPMGISLTSYKFNMSFDDGMPAPNFSTGLLYPPGAPSTGSIRIAVESLYVEKSGSWTLRWTPPAK